MLDTINVLYIISKKTIVVSKFIQKVIKRNKFCSNKKFWYIINYRVKAISINRQVVNKYIKRSLRQLLYNLKIRNFKIIIKLVKIEAIIRNLLFVFTKILVLLIITTFFIFCKCNLKTNIIVTLLLFNNCVILILWKTFKDANRVNFFNFTTREDFFEKFCLLLCSLFLIVLRFDIIEISLQD